MERLSRWSILLLAILLAQMITVRTPVCAQDTGQDDVTSALTKLTDPAVAVRQEALDALRSNSGDPRVITPLIHALTDQEPGVRTLAAEVLGETHAPRAVPPLLQLLRDPDREVCAAAIEALGLLGDPRAVEPLIGMLQREQTLQLKAIDALSHLNDARAVPPLLTVLQDPDVQVSGAAAEALGYLGDSRAVEPLLAAARDEHNPFREHAVSALGNLREPRALPLLLPLLTGKDQALRGTAIDALARLADTHGVDALLPLLNDSDLQTRILAIQALGSMRDSRAVATLNRLLATAEEDAQVRVYAAEALGQIRDAQAVPALLTTLDGKDQALANSAVVALDALTKIGSADAADVLISRAAGDDNGLRIPAIRALGAGGSAKAIPVLRDSLGAEDEQVRAEALLALAKTPDDRAVQAVLTFVSNKTLPGMADETALVSALSRNPKVTTETLVALAQQRQNPALISEVVVVLGKAKVQDPRLLPVLVRWISTTSFNLTDDIMAALTPYGTPLVDALMKAVQQSTTTQLEMVVQVLSRTGDARVIETLLPLLHRPGVDHGVVLEALARLKYAKAYPLLLEAAQDKKGDACLGAIAGLGLLTDARAVTTLLGALREQEGEMAPLLRAAAAVALGQIGDAHATVALITALSDDMEDVRTSAALALAGLPPDPREIDPLLALLCDMRSNDGSDRQAAITALLRLRNERIVPAVTAAVEREPKLRMAWLAEHHTARTLCLLLRVLHDEPDASARVLAASTLATLHDPQAIPHLISALRDEDPEVRTAAQSALKTLNAQ